MHGFEYLRKPLADFQPFGWFGLNLGSMPGVGIAVGVINLTMGGQTWFAALAFLFAAVHMAVAMVLWTRRRALELHRAFEVTLVLGGVLSLVLWFSSPAGLPVELTSYEHLTLLAVSGGHLVMFLLVCGLGMLERSYVASAGQK